YDAAARPVWLGDSLSGGCHPRQPRPGLARAGDHRTQPGVSRSISRTVAVAVRASARLHPPGGPKTFPLVQVPPPAAPPTVVGGSSGPSPWSRAAASRTARFFAPLSTIGAIGTSGSKSPNLFIPPS